MQIIAKTMRTPILAAVAFSLVLAMSFGTPSSRDRVDAAVPGFTDGNPDGESVKIEFSELLIVSASTPAAPQSAPGETLVAEPLPHQWIENATPLTNGYLKMAHGELTSGDGGRDVFSFTGQGGENYIVEVEGRLDVHDDGDVHYVEHYLVDPSILEIVNQDGVQIMGEQDQGGL